MKKVFFIVLSLIFMLSTTAKAEDTVHPSRVRLLIHGKLPINETSDLKVHFIPAGNLKNGVSPITYLNYNFQVFDGLWLAPTLGWSSGKDEGILGMQFSPAFGNFYGWFDVEMNYPNYGAYFFGQAEYKVLPAIHFGVETEGGGNWEEWTWDKGFGPNLIVNLNGKMQLDMAFHYREENDKVLPQLFLRVHLFMF